MAYSNYSISDVNDNDMLPEASLITLLKNGDISGYDTLYSKYGAALYGVAFRMAGNRERADEILVEVFSRIKNVINEYDESKGRFLIWLLTIVKKVSSDKSSWQHRTKSPFPAPVAHADSHLTLIQSAAVTPAQKRIIDLSFLQGYSAIEISKQLSLPVTEVRLALRQAILAVRKSI